MRFHLKTAKNRTNVEEYTNSIETWKIEYEKFDDYYDTATLADADSIDEIIDAIDFTSFVLKKPQDFEPDCDWNLTIKDGYIE